MPPGIPPRGNGVKGGAVVCCSNGLSHCYSSVMSSREVDVALAQSGSQLIDALLQLPEDQWFERKSGRIAAKNLSRPLIAFANAEGGTIVVGLHSGSFDGVAPQLENDIRQASIDFTVPPVRVQTTGVEVDGKRLLVIRVESGETVHADRSGDCFLRIGDESRKLSLAEQQELAYDRGGRPFESTLADISAEDLSHDQLDSYRAAIGSSSTDEMLVARDLVDRRGRLTVAGELLFDERPQRDFPSAYVRVIKYDDDARGVGAEMSLVEDVRIDGSIPHQIMDAAALVERLLPHRQQLGESGRFERVPILPRDAWLEGVVNAVVHRSYNMMGDHIRVEIFPRRMEISSPGRFPGLVNPARPLSISRYARNPRIARVCADMGITRELGEGIKRIFQEMRRRGLAEPIYRQSSASVSLVLSASDAVDSEVLAGLNRTALKVLDTLRLQGRPLGTGQIAEFAGVARPTAGRALHSLAEAGLVRWEGTSDRDPRASWRLL